MRGVRSVPEMSSGVVGVSLGSITRVCIPVQSAISVLAQQGAGEIWNQPYCDNLPIISRLP